jgi:hypothetical protein
LKGLVMLLYNAVETGIVVDWLDAVGMLSCDSLGMWSGSVAIQSKQLSIKDV